MVSVKHIDKELLNIYYLKNNFTMSKLNILREKF